MSAIRTRLRPRALQVQRDQIIAQVRLGVMHRSAKRSLPVRTEALQEVVGRARGLRRRVGTLYLFANRDGQPYTSSGFDSIWRRMKKKSGLMDLHFHDLRAKTGSDSGNTTMAALRHSTAQRLRHAQAQLVYRSVIKNFLAQSRRPDVTCVQSTNVISLAKTQARVAHTTQCAFAVGSHSPSPRP